MLRYSRCLVIGMSLMVPIAAWAGGGIHFHWPETPRFVVPVASAVALLGLCLCFFGWKIFRVYTIVTGVLSGIMLGLVLSWVAANAITENFLEDATQTVLLGIFVVLGIPLAWLGAKLGRRFAMFGARAKSLAGIGAGLVGTAFALTRFAFFDLSIVWGHALIGAFLIVVAINYGVSTLTDLSDEQSQYLLYASLAIALPICVMGAGRQIKQLRSAAGSRY